MGRIRTSSNILLLKGSFKGHPERDRTKDIPQCKKKLPKKPPENLTETEQGTWREIKKLIPDGVAFASDLILLEICAVMLTDFRRNKTDFSAAHLTRLCVCLDKLGLSPSGRENLKIERKKKQTSEFK